jgi:hypothetical protein
MPHERDTLAVVGLISGWRGGRAGAPPGRRNGTLL